MTAKLKKFLFENSTLRQTILKNTFWMSFGQIASRLIRAVVIIYAARILGAAGYGVFSYALSLAGFFTIFSDIGLTPFLTRESAKAPELRMTYIATSFTLKLCLVAINSIIILVAVPFITKMPGAIPLLPFLIVLFAFDSIRDFSFAVTRSIQKMETEAGINILTNIAILAFGLGALFFFGTAKALMIAYTVGTGIGMIIGLWTLRSYFHKFWTSFSKAHVKPILLEAWPFGVSALLSTIMLNTDTIMLGAMRTEAEVGYYSAAQRIISILYLIPGFLSVSVFPVMAQLAIKNKERFVGVLEKALRAVLLVAFPIALGGAVLASPLILFIFGKEYLPAAVTLQILLFNVFFVFPGSIINNGIFAFGKQKQLLVAFAIGGIGNVILNFLLIPTFGIAGSAAATIVTQFLSNGYTFFAMQRITPFTSLGLVKRIAPAGIIMTIAALCIHALGAHVIITVCVSGILYAGLLYVFREELITNLRTEIVNFFNPSVRE